MDIRVHSEPKKRCVNIPLGCPYTVRNTCLCTMMIHAPARRSSHHMVVPFDHTIRQFQSTLCAHRVHIVCWIGDRRVQEESGESHRGSWSHPSLWLGLVLLFLLLNRVGGGIFGLGSWQPLKLQHIFSLPEEEACDCNCVGLVSPLKSRKETVASEGVMSTMRWTQ